MLAAEGLAALYPAITVILGGGGAVGGVYALLKLRPEAGQITVMAAQGAVIAQTGVIDTMRAEMSRIVARLDVLEAERTRLLDEAATLRVNNVALRERVLHLEEEIAALKSRRENLT